MRALFLAREISAVKHWRCLLAYATPSDAGFAPLPTQPLIAPRFLDGAAKVASYYHTLFAAISEGVSDDPDSERRKLVGVAVETVLREQFSDIREPVPPGERAILVQRFRTLVLRLRGEQATAPGVPPTDDELDAFTRATSDPSEAKRLFCSH